MIFDSFYQTAKSKVVNEEVNVLLPQCSVHAPNRYKRHITIARVKLCANVTY